MYNKLCYVVATYSKKGRRHLLRSGKSKQETASLPGFGNNGEATFMHVHDLPGNTEPDARTCWFGGEERDEDTFLHIRRDACSVVTDLDICFPFRINPGRQFNRWLTAILSGVDGVSDQVDQYLLDHSFIRNDLQMGGDGKYLDDIRFLFE